jgi:hypothetical protein
VSPAVLGPLTVRHASAVGPGRRWWFGCSSAFCHVTRCSGRFTIRARLGGVSVRRAADALGEMGWVRRTRRVVVVVVVGLVVGLVGPEPAGAQDQGPAEPEGRPDDAEGRIAGLFRLSSSGRGRGTPRSDTTPWRWRAGRCN